MGVFEIKSIIICRKKAKEKSPYGVVFVGNSGSMDYYEGVTITREYFSTSSKRDKRWKELEKQIKYSDSARVGDIISLSGETIEVE